MSAVRAEPMRRRLTVSHGASSAGGADGPPREPDLKEIEKIEAAGLTRIFQEATKRESRAVCVTSKTDNELMRKRSFADKDQEVMSNCEDSAEDVKAWVNSLGISWKCHKGLKPESPNQDSFSILLVEQEFALYCVYDGHGPKGHDVSDISRTYVVNCFLTRIKAGADPKAAFLEAFETGQKLFMDLSDKFDKTSGKDGTDASMSGTTCTMAYHDVVKRKIWVAHVGDSRAVIGHRLAGGKVDCQDLTEDHKPNLKHEQKRIEEAGGRVVFDGFYNHRVFAAKGMYPGLNMSRALGDCIGHKEAGLCATPDVKEIDLSAYDGDLLLLLCTDGVWEFIQSEEAVQMIMNKEDQRTMPERLGNITQTSWDRWMGDSENEISDDITGIAVVLQGPVA